MRLISAAVGLALIAWPMAFGQTRADAQTHQDTKQECVAALSGFPEDASTVTPPPYPPDLSGVSIEYFESGCYGKCPSFTLTVTNGLAKWDGHAYVRAKGKRKAKVSQQQFEGFLHAWYEGKFFAMREDYCNPTCPNGMVIIVNDIPESSITLRVPGSTKRVYQCFAKIDDHPITPKPPDEYFQLVRQLREFAKAHGWLK